MRILVNPKAKKGRAPIIASSIVRIWNGWGWDCQMVVPQGPARMREETRKAVTDKVDAVIVVGGDGTIHHALPELAFQDIPMGILPCGRGNDLVRALGLPTRPFAAAQALRTTTIRTIDLGMVNGRFFCGIVTCGLDSVVADFAYRHRSIPGGWIGYFAATLILLARFSFPTVTVKTEDWEFSGSVVVSATANCPAYGGGMWIAPTALLDDGFLDLCVVRKTSKWKILRLLPSLFWGGHIREPEVSLHRSRWVSLSSPFPLPLFADGEPVGTTTATIRVERGALRLLVPTGTKRSAPSLTSSS
ncbi:MAG: diacylglycerol kinase family lipid kinase [Armatimonadetes bacterium]|nr:diacylglycerol kinase family lipid kinase [Armatimonadota bacterium]MDW8120735.1 diacylglycerol kinase family lipid kinase [Armatimonadota bacterium]